MYLCGGYVYIYLIYGIYHCLNITAAVENDPQAVLIRGMIPVDGTALMLENRRLYGRCKQEGTALLSANKIRTIADGPGKLCTVMGITREMNCLDLCAPNTQMYVTETDIRPIHVDCLPRVGIDYAGEDRDKLWRYLAHF